MFHTVTGLDIYLLVIQILYWDIYDITDVNGVNDISLH
jgi:hypothetical protein